jgi:hypothetical protein
MHQNLRVLLYHTKQWRCHQQIFGGFLIVKNIFFLLYKLIDFSRPSILQPVSLLKLIFDGLSLLIGISFFYLFVGTLSFSFGIVLLTWLLFKYLVKPVRRAFLCSDLSLYHPPPEKKVFPTWLLFVCAIIIPLIVVC